MNGNSNSNKKIISTNVSSEKLFSLISFATAVLAMILLALSKTIYYFNIMNKPTTCATVAGVFSIFVFALTIAGAVLAYFVKNGKPSAELFLNMGVFVAGIFILS